MTKIDQFESVFRAASKVAFHHEPVTVESVLVVTDLDDRGTAAFQDRARRTVRALDMDTVNWRSLDGDAWHGASSLLEHVVAERPGLLCTYRNLRSPDWKYPYSLGEALDVLTQHTDFPVLILPHPEVDAPAPASGAEHTVMAITDHLTGDDTLVNVAAALTEPGGTLVLAHVEDDAAFERVMDAISKIPAIETEEARAALWAQLLKEPHDYVTSCREALETAGLPLEVGEVVTFGHHLTEYRRLIEEHGVDLVVLHGKDEDQLAMHGRAYALAVELRTTPMLML